jgi:hypothetical protein
MTWKPSGRTICKFQAHVDVHDWRREVWSIAIYDDKATDIGKEYAALEARGATPEELHIAFGNLLRNNDNANALKIGNEFLELIKQRIPKVVGHAKKLSSNARSTILQHPFLTYYEDAVNLLQIARESPSDAAVHCKAAFFLFIASFEGLMNLVYELYARPDLRDDRLFERLSREQIDIKIRLAPLYCVCFLTTLIDSNSDVFRLFQSIINLWNDFIHANLTRPMRRPVVVEDGHVFIVDQVATDSSGLPRNIDGLEPKHIAIVQAAVEQMVELIISSMRPKYRREFKNLVWDQYVIAGEKIIERS